MNIKKTLYNILGQSVYLKLMNIGFFTSYHLGLLKNNSIYKYHYLVDFLVEEGDHVIDIGGNLGYYSKLFFKRVGKYGSLISVEPVKPYYDVLKWSVGSHKNFTLFPYALGKDEMNCKMVIPKGYDAFRTGLTKVKSDEDVDMIEYDAKMINPSVLFKNIPEINYIKMDIEGYEYKVLQEMIDILEQHKPTLQVEITNNIEETKKLLTDIGYKFYYYSFTNKNFTKDSSSLIEFGDTICVHNSKENAFILKCKSNNLL